METALHITYSHWLILAMILLALEVFGAGGFLIGMAIASLALALVTWLSPGMDWQPQLVAFALISVAATYVYWRSFKGFNNRSDQPELNHKTSQFVGRRFALQQSLVGGMGRQQIGDTFWKIKADGELAEGSLVEVYGAEGSELLVKPIDRRGDTDGE
ncbi:Inner membrane protein YbbJ [Sinobacterium norvegicum]|uniref:Inner membrane protein YbbJ n=1 Tax=Sinobacterium norvegicum TaxID=1641715 RepID=A0ABM9AGS7_9GAMM|nr:NfeD family protein [Sinobacterium norvegicum]CAH0992354.1 Inner membrane protein YbbJ [Sinobacterium norvegicum]